MQRTHIISSYIWCTLQNIIFLKKIGDEVSPGLDVKCWTQRILLPWLPEMLQLWTCTDIIVLLWLFNLIDSVQKYSAASGSLHFQQRSHSQFLSKSHYNLYGFIYRMLSLKLCIIWCSFLKDKLSLLWKKNRELQGQMLIWLINSKFCSSRGKKNVSSASLTTCQV